MNEQRLNQIQEAMKKHFKVLDKESEKLISMGDHLNDDVKERLASTVNEFETRKILTMQTEIMATMALDLKMLIKELLSDVE